MPRLLSYADAVTLLGGEKSRIVTALDHVAGGILLGAAPAVPAILSLFDAKADFIRLSHDLVRTVRERRSGLSRFTRTQRLHGAHTVIVVTAFFEAAAATELPYRFEAVELTREEQIMIAGGCGPAALTELCRSTSVPLPAPHESTEDFQDRLGRFYGDYATLFHGFVAGLAAGEALADASNVRKVQLVELLAEAAQRRYRELIDQLAVDFPEIAWWAGTREHAATRAAVREARREVGGALAGVERMLADITTGRAPDQRRVGLACSYRAALGRPITASGDAPSGLRIPTLGEAYVEPLFRVANVSSAALASDHGWWELQPIRDQLELLLTGYLTSPQASIAPLLVLGEPGSGKSVLTKVLAARLPAEDFLPVRVVLRDVPAHADLQDQIEYAIRDATGERVLWPDLARSAGDALPVVILDGFDELLQATGTSQSDYLINVARFQEREALQGRPVAVIVTSRTSVADRANPAQDTTALRLEPFDDLRITTWLDKWNAANAYHVTSNGLAPLPAATVLAHRELASQPLLLLMLALYDASGNGLQHLTGTLGEGELYERLLQDFCEREITKHRHGLRPRELRLAIEDELRQLSVVSFGMFNRRAQWITEVELDRDLGALVGTRAPSPASTMRAQLGQAETLLGRFFFIHRSQATRDDNRLQTYEFLHATFGEYLVARFTWRVLLDTVARESASTLRLAASADDDLLHALLSFAVLCVRAPIIGFLQEQAAQLGAERREELLELLLRLFHAVHDQRPARAYADYQPRPLGIPARHAAYGANLMVLAVCVAGTLSASDLYPGAGHSGGRDPVDRWHSEALLWRSQLDGENWSSIVDAVWVQRIQHDDHRDLRLSLGDGSAVTPPFELSWTYHGCRPSTRGGTEGPGGTVWAHHHPDVLRRKAYFQCGNLDDVVHHALEPLALALPDTVNTMIKWEDGSQSSVAQLLLQLWLSPPPALSGRADASEKPATIYRRVAGLISGKDTSQLLFSSNPPRVIAASLFERLAADNHVPASVVAELLTQLADKIRTLGLKQLAARCLRAHLARDASSDRLIALAGLQFLLPWDRGDLDRDHAEALVRIREVTPEVAGDLPWHELHAIIVAGWPDLAARLTRAETP